MDDRQPVSLFRRALSYLICGLIATQPLLPAFAAQVTPVTPGTKMGAAGNGVPVVNITTPNQAGISHNQYQQYNVGKEGLILNNGTNRLTQTQLGGLIQNNPNLKAGQEAKAIINEVVGANRSQLQGYTEVAGKAANVMVANPYGITCNGCGFINTPNATLTTGKPQFDAQGNLKSLDVTKGAITIEGKGLDGSQSDAVSIISRATEINAGIYAKDLSVTLGANRVGQDGSVTPIAGEGAAPSVAVDTGALGGMYANRIHLVSSEKGVGVNLGNLNARQGDMVLDASGRLAVKSALVQGKLTASGSSVTMSGSQKADSLSIASSGEITLDQANVSASHGADIQGKALVIKGGSLAADVINLKTDGKLSQDQNSTLKADKTLSLQANQLQLAGTSGAEDMQLSATELTSQSTAALKADKTLSLNLSGISDVQGELTAGQAFNANYGELTQRGILAASQMTFSGDVLDNQGKILADRQLNVRAGQLRNSGSLIGQDMQLSAPMISNSGLLQSNGDFMLTSSENFSQQPEGRLLASGSLKVNAGLSDTAGSIQAQSLSWQGSNWQNRAKVNALGDASLHLTGELSNSGALLSGNNLSADSASLRNDGSLLADNALDINSDNVSNSGTVMGTTLLLSGSGLDNSGLMQAQQDIRLTLNQAFKQSAAGSLLAGGMMKIEASSGETDGNIQANSLNWMGNSWLNLGEAKLLHDADISLSNRFGNEGVLFAGDKLSLMGNAVENHGTLQSDSIVLTAEQLTNRGQLLAGELRFDTGSVQNDGLIQASSELTLNADRFTQQSEGQLFAGESLNVNVGQADTGGDIRTAQLHWQGTNWRNIAAVVTPNDASVALDDLFENHGSLSGNGNWDLTAKQTVNSGSLQGDKLLLNTSKLSNTGQVFGNDVLLATASLENNGLLQGSDSLHLMATDHFKQLQQGQLLAGNALEVFARGADTGGEIQAGAINWQGDDWTNNGTVKALGSSDLSLQGSITNSGELLANNKTSVKSHQLDNRGLMQASVLETLGTVLLNTGSVVADALTANYDRLQNNGTLQSSGELTLALADKFEQQQSGQLLAGGRLTVKAPNTVTAGVITANIIDLQGAQWQNEAKVSAVDRAENNLNQSLINNGQLIAQNGWLLTAPSLSNSGILQAGDLTFSGQTFSNQGTTTGLNSLSVRAAASTDNSGQLQSGGNAILDAPIITNTGSLLAQSWTVTGGDFSNRGTVLGQQKLDLDLSRQITNHGAAKLLSGSSASLHTSMLINDGVMQAGGQLDINIIGDVTNQGRIQGDGGLTLSTHKLVNPGSITSNQLTLTTSGLNNSGLIQGQQILNVNAGSILVNQSTGQMLSGGNATLRGDTMSNSGWVQSAGMDLATSQLDQNGTLLVTGTLILNSNRLNNNGITQGNSTSWTGDGLTNNGTLLGLASLALQANQIINNASGKLWARDNLRFTTGDLQQKGQLLALGNLNGTVNGSFALNTAMAAGNDLSLHVGGDFTQQGTLQGNSVNISSGGKLINRGNITSGNGASSLHASSLDLTDNGSVQGGGNFSLTSDSDLINSGFVGTLGDLTVQAGALLQNSSLLYAGNNLRLYATRLHNLHGDILAENNLGLQRDAQGNGSSEIINRSGTIETRKGDINLNTAHLINDRDGLSVTEQDAALAVPAWAGGAVVEIPISWFEKGDYGIYTVNGHEYHGHGDSWYEQVPHYAPYEKADVQTVAVKSSSIIVNPGGSQARISSGHNISGYTGVLENNASAILAANDISLSGVSLSNKSWTDGVTTQYQTYRYGVGVNKPSRPEEGMSGNPEKSTITYTAEGTPVYETTGSGNTYSAVIQAGGAINAAFSSDISNTSVRPNSGFATEITSAPGIHAINSAGTLTVQNTRQLAGNGDVLPSGTLSNRQKLTNADFNDPAVIKASELAQQQPVSVGNLHDQLAANFITSRGGFTTAQLADYPLPVGNSGLFVLDSDKSSRYLIRTNPKLSALGQLDNGLFSQLAAMTGSQPTSTVRVETSALLTNTTQFLGSDYLLGKLNLDTDHDYRFLGDAAFDTRYVSNAVISQTGERYLGGTGSDLSQMQYLMDNAAAAQQSLNLTLGISLNADQIASLDHSIIWWENVIVDGQTVLAPKLYLAKVDSTNLQGSSIIANNVSLSSDGNVVNSGGVKAVQLLDLSAGSVTNESGGLLKSDGSLNLTALGNITNLSSTIQGSNIALNSINGSVINKTLSTEASVSGTVVKNYWNTSSLNYSTTQLAKRAEISGDTVSINAGNNIENQGATLKATQDMSLKAGKDLQISANKVSYINRYDTKGSAGRSTGTESTSWSSSDVSAGGNLTAQAGHNLEVTASNVKADGNATLEAGNNLNLNSSITSQNTYNGGKETHSTDLDAATVLAGSNLLLNAGKDITSQAAALAANGNVILQAGRDINLNAVATGSGNSDRGGKKTIINETVRQQGSEIASGGNLSLAATHNINSQASNITAKRDLAAQAGHDVNITTATESNYAYQEETKTKKGLFSKKTTHTIKEDSSTAEKASQLSGDHVSIVAGNDLSVKGSSVVGESDVGLKAGHDLTIAAATEQQSSYRLSETRTSGMFSGGGLGVTFGSASSRQQLNQDGTTQSQSASAVGSTGGSITLVAGNNARVAGSDVIAKKDINLVGGSVSIDPGNDTLSRRQIYEQKQSGLTLRLTSPITDALLSLNDQVKGISEAGDDRLKALYAVKMLGSGWAMSQNGTVGSAQALANGDMQQAGIQIQLSVGASKSTSSSEYKSNSVSGSSLNAGGNVAVVATGANGTSGDLNITGSGVTGKNVTLAASHDLNLQAATDNQQQQSSNKSSGWSGGVHVSIGKETGIGIQASGFMASGNENGNSTDYVNTRINASDTLTLSSGNDTLLSGAQALGNRINADVGNNLTLSSLQDTDNYQSKQQSASGGFSFTFGSMTGSVGLSLSQTKVNSEYASVGDQSGLFAGEGGYNVYVGNHTQLNGAVIASTADAANNALSTGTLGWDSINNHAEYTASSSSFGFSAGNTGGKMSGMALPTSANAHEDASGVTKSAVSDGTIIIRNVDAQTQRVADLSRDTDNANGHIDKIFDKDKVAQQMEFTQGVQQLAGQVVSDVTSYKLTEAKKETADKLLKEHPEYANLPSDKFNELIESDASYKAVSAKWGTGGAYSMAASAVAAALGGLSANNLGAAASGAMAPYIANAIKQATTTLVDGKEQTNLVANTMAHALAGAVLAQLAGNNAVAGATGAAGGELTARGIIAIMYPGKDGNELNESEKKAVSALSQLAAGLASGIASNSSSGAITGVGAGKNAVENNALGDDDGLEHEHRLGIQEPEIVHITNGVGQKHDADGKPVPGTYGTGIGPAGNLKNEGNGAKGATDSLIASALSPFKDGQAITSAGRAVTKHPEYFGFNSTQELRQVYRLDAQLNDLAEKSVQDILESGVKTTGAGGRYPNGWVTYSLPDGRAASWSASGEFIGFRGRQK